MKTIRQLIAARDAADKARDEAFAKLERKEISWDEYKILNDESWRAAQELRVRRAQGRKSK